VICRACGDDFCAKRDWADDVDLIFQRCVDAAFGHFGHHRAGHAAIKQCAVPATMHSAHRVGVIECGGAAEDDLARCDLIKCIVENGRDRWARQSSCLDPQHKVEPGHGFGLVKRGQVGGALGGEHSPEAAASGDVLQA